MRSTSDRHALGPMMLDPVGFWSYARHDDAHSDGQLSQLRVIVGKAIGLQYGAEVTLWQDIAAISYGADWAETIERTLGQTTFFMPIVTPRFLKSQNCLEEYVSFRRRMAELGRNDLVFPVHYVGVDDIKAADTVFGEDLAKLRGHQWIDFRPLFYADPRSPEVRRWAGGLATSILKALRKDAAPGSRAATGARTRASAHAVETVDADAAEQPFVRAPERAATSRPTVDDAEPMEEESPKPSGRARRPPPLTDDGALGRPWRLAVIAAVVGLGLSLAFVWILFGSSSKTSTSGQVSDSKAAVIAVPSKVVETEAPALAVDGGIPVKVGDTADVVRTAFHTDKTAAPMGTDSDYARERTMLRLDEQGIWFFFDPQGKLYNVRFDKPWTGSVAGIRIGDPQAKVEADLGTPQASTGSTGPYLFESRYIYRKAGVFLASYDFDSAHRVETIMVP